MEGDLRRLLNDNRASLVLERDATMRPVVSFAEPRGHRSGPYELRLIKGQVLARLAPGQGGFGLGECQPVSVEGVTAPAVPGLGSDFAVPAAAIAHHPVKRCLDVLIASVLLLLLTPLLFYVGLLVLLDRHGPVLFLQRRSGLNGTVFRICKFRTMKVCDDGERVAQTRQGDKRITRLGRILRRTSIDELPQLINVPTGDMSLVGPRPHATAHDRAFARALPGYSARFRVRPGITGLAQIRGQRGAIRNREQLAGRVASDLEYIERWSVLTDLRILVASFGVVFRSDGA